MKLSKTLAFGLLLFLSMSIWAEEDIFLVTKNIQTFCMGNRLIFENTELLDYSENKFNKIEKSFEDEVLCQENKKYIDLIFKNSNSIVTNLTFQKREEDKYLYSSEICSGKECQIEVHHFRIYDIKMNFLGFEFSKYDDEFLFKKQIYWNSDFCPPFNPDCDL